jgi:hypothetical protein
MKPRHLQIILLLSVLAINPTSAGEPAMELFKDFADRLEAAVGTKDVSAVIALYQTNGVPAVGLAGEVAKWQRILAGDARGKMFWYGKELATLPSEQARRFWSEYVQRLTEREVTHVVAIRFGGGAQFLLPLVSAQGKLWIVPSEKNSGSIEIGSPGGLSLPAPTPPDMRVRVRRFQSD